MPCEGIRAAMPIHQLGRMEPARRIQPRIVQRQAALPPRLLDGDARIVEALQKGELGDLTRDDPGRTAGQLALQVEASHA